jgi:glycosyltransferase involved in cell wall biosynthesis
MAAASSFASQRHPDKALVVVDDGSSDGSWDEVRSAMAGTEEHAGGVRGRLCGIPAVLLRHDSPRGPAAARNSGIRSAWGWADCFALLDSDDEYLPGKVEESVAAMEADPMVGVVYTDYLTVAPDGLVTREFKEPYSRERLTRECVVNCDSLVTKAALEAAGLFDESLRVCEDYDLWLRVTEHRLAHHVPKALVSIRVGGHSSTSTVNREVWEGCHRRVFEKLGQRG